MRYVHYPEKRIEIFTDMAILMVGSVTVQEKVAERLKSRNAVSTKNGFIKIDNH